MRDSTYILICRLFFLVSFTSYTKTKPRSVLNVYCFFSSDDSVPLSYILPNLVKNFLYLVIFSTSKICSKSEVLLTVSQHLFWFGGEADEKSGELRTISLHQEYN